MKSPLTKNLSLLLILFIAIFLRFWQLGQNPPSLFADEVSNGYNAYSILKTAKDEYGNFLPLTFRAFGDYNPALSAYLLVPSIAVFGLNEFAVRFPSALLGVLTVLFTYLMVKELFPLNESRSINHQSWKSQNDHNSKFMIHNSEKISLLAAFFLAVSPWHLQFSRYDHEANFMITFTILGLVIFLKSHKKSLYLFLSAISFGLALNSYHGAKIWVPIFLLSIIYWYRKEILDFGKRLLLPLSILLISTLPAVLNFPNSLIRGQSVGIFGKDKPLETFFSGYLSHYSPNFLFISGDSIPRHSVAQMGELYVFELPLILIGLITFLKSKTRGTKFLLTWFLLAPIPAALATPTPHALRSLTFLPLWSIIAACALGKFAITKFNKKLKTILVFLIVVIGIYNFVTYLHLYYKHYPKLTAPDWGDGYREMVNYIDRIKDDYSTIAVTNFFGKPYIYILFYSKYDPSKYQSQSEDKNAFDKFEFFGSSWAKTKPGKALVVTPPWQAHPPKVLKNIYAINGDLKFTISETE